MTYAIELRALRKAFGPRVAVDDFDLAIPTGALVGFIGPNGAGKTTTIRMVMSIIFPDRGTIKVLGRASAVESKDRIGYLPEERGLYKKMKVGAFLAYMARLKGMDGDGLDNRVQTWLERVGLGDCAKKRCEELSKGMQQKVQFISAVIHEPDLLILDEPFSGLDPVNSRVLRGLIDEQHRAGKTIIFSTHQMSQAEALCDRIVMIHQGRKVLDDTPGAIRSRFDPRAVELEAGKPNVAAALGALPEVVSTHAHNGRVRVELREGVEAAEMIPRLASVTGAHRIEVVRPTLEDIFIEIVQDTVAESERELLRASLRNGGRGDRGGD
ncbi:MAG: ABC transporter ATP-binding protein [Phycisphaerae bacterium]|nr:MAG: ABC transporter ATP-binding protein [Phycisphaerae bacterium]